MEDILDIIKPHYGESKNKTCETYIDILVTDIENGITRMDDMMDDIEVIDAKFTKWDVIRKVNRFFEYNAS